MMKRKGIAVGVASVLAGFVFVGAMASGVAEAADKVDVCQLRGNGTYGLINVSTNALDGFLARGGGQPGDPVPGMDGAVFNDYCEPVSACPAEIDGAVENFEGAGFRVKSAAGPDAYLGVSDLGGGSNRVQGTFGNPPGNGSYPVTFAWDSTENKITLTGPGGVNLTYDFDDEMSLPACDSSAWDTLKIIVSDNSKTSAGVALNNVGLNSCLLGDFGEVDTAGNTGFQQWYFDGFDFSGDFVLSGNLEVENWSNADNERVKVEVLVGCAVAP